MSTKATTKKDEKKVLDLTNPQNKKAFIDAQKNAIKNETKIDLKAIDFNNLKNKIKVSNIKVKETIEKTKMYKFESTIVDLKELKKLRSKMRNKRNAFANNIILNFQKENVENLIKEVNNFDKFYKENYILNDYSLISISSNNRDKETEILLTSMLNIIKELK